MATLKEKLLKRKNEIIKFLSKHFYKDTQKKDNFVSEYPNYSESDLNMDPSSEANEVADYGVNLEIEHTIENELTEIEDKLKEL